MITVFAQLAGWAVALLQGAGYPGVAAMVGLESAGLPLPGETALVAASYLAATGHLSLPLVVGAAALGSAFGDSAGYLVGRSGGRRFLERHGRWLGLTPEKLRKADLYFLRHGAKTVFFGRFVALLRILNGPLAGASGMPYRRFLVANAAGAAVWATAIGTLAYLFGGPIVALLGYAGLWALVAVAAFLVLRPLVKRLVSRRTAAPEEAAEPVGKDEVVEELVHAER